jgi:DNA-binding transcriptional ArsR family regulator
MEKNPSQGSKEKTFLVRSDGKKNIFASVKVLESPSSLKVINHDARVRILQLLSKKPLYPAEIAKVMGMHEQKVYYHIKQLVNAGLLEVDERKEIRGTVAKKFRPTDLNFAVAFGEEWKPMSELFRPEIEPKLGSFLGGLVSGGSFDGKFIVGSPDPHGEFKAYSRDGHYAVDLALFFGTLTSMPSDFSVMLDVDVKKEKVQSENLVLVGGPVTNTLVSEINDLLPIKFSNSRPWGIKSTRTSKEYTDDSVGLIAKIPNPFNKENSILVIAGIRFIGTKSAVMALTRHNGALLEKFSGEKSWAAVVQGYDMDGDGRIDEVEILE